MLRCRMCVQEAVSVGLDSATTFDDNIISSYRTHPFVVLRGGDVKSLIGELLGRVCGVSKGKGGSMHVFTEAFQGGHGIVGAQVPLGAGLALRFGPGGAAPDRGAALRLGARLPRFAGGVGQPR